MKLEAFSKHDGLKDLAAFLAAVDAIRALKRVNPDLSEADAVKTRWLNAAAAPETVGETLTRRSVIDVAVSRIFGRDPDELQAAVDLAYLYLKTR
jgi:hypothetical protein